LLIEFPSNSGSRLRRTLFLKLLQCTSAQNVPFLVRLQLKAQKISGLITGWYERCRVHLT